MTMECGASGQDDREVMEAAAATAARPVSDEERRRLVAESLQVGNPGNRAQALPTEADTGEHCPIELEVDQVRPYEHNPRRTGNARFEQIKASIRASGIRNPLTVTRRPGEAHFIVEAGGNTRLLAVQQLWAETGDPRFQKLLMLFRPWRSESHVLSAHLVENEQRGEMTFWDKATGVVALKARLEDEQGRVLSLRQLEAEMTRLGLSVNTATLAHYLFASERLRILGEAVPGLSGLDVKTLQPRLNALKRYAQGRMSITEDELYATVFEPAFRRAADQYQEARSFSIAAVCRACEEALGQRLGESVGHVPSARSPAPQPILDTSPALSGTNEPGQPLAREPHESESPWKAETTVSTADASVAARDDAPVPSTHLVEQVQRLAQLAGLEACLRLDRAAPLGFHVLALPDTAEGEFAAAARRRVWSLLALLAAPLDEPPSNEEVDALPFDAPFLCWLIEPHDEAASASWNLLALIRASRSATRALGGRNGEMAAEAA